MWRGGAAHLLRFFFQKSCVYIREKPPQLYDDVADLTSIESVVTLYKRKHFLHEELCRSSWVEPAHCLNVILAAGDYTMLESLAVLGYKKHPAWHPGCTKTKPLRGPLTSLSKFRWKNAWQMKWTCGTLPLKVSRRVGRKSRSRQMWFP